MTVTFFLSLIKIIRFVSLSVKSKLLSFGCNVHEVNGHNIKSLKEILKKKNKNKPKVIIAHTTKGKGVSFMENNNLWHYKNPNKKELDVGLREINIRYA